MKSMKNYILMALFCSVGFLSEANLVGVQSAGYPQIGMDSSGNSVAVWQILNDDDFYEIQAATKPFNDVWTTPVTLSDAGLQSYLPFVAVNSSGDGVAVYVTQDTLNGIDTLRARILSGGTWSSEVVLSGSSEVNGDHVVAISGDDIIVTWSAYPTPSSSYAVIYAAHGSVSGPSWDTTEQISP